MYNPYEPYENGYEPKNNQPEDMHTQSSPAPEAAPVSGEGTAQVQAQSRPAENTYTADMRQESPYTPAAPASGMSGGHGEPEPPRKKKGGKKFLKLVAAACVFGILAGACFGGVNLIFDQASGGKTVQTETTPTLEAQPSENVNTDVDIPYTTVQTSTDTGTAVLDVSEVVKNTMPAMVSINVMVTETVTNPYGGFFGYGGGTYEYETPASGSGIIIGKNDTELLIVTNNHVVGDASQIAIEFIDGTSATAYIKGTDENSDLAVVAVALSDLTEDTLNNIKIAVMGSSDDLELGEPAIAIGNALGYGQSVTVGYISALEREVTLTDGTMTLIQTDAAINPGNSGGALLNINGEVVGINSAKYSDTDVEGMGYAIPISDAIPIINELMNAVTVPDSEKPYLGITGQEVPVSYQSYFGWPEGVYVIEVSADSPAALAGLRAGDIITGFNGTEITTMDALQDALADCAVGDVAQLTVVRIQNAPNGQSNMEEMTLSATLIARSDAEAE